MVEKNTQGGLPPQGSNKKEQKKGPSSVVKVLLIGAILVGGGLFFMPQGRQLIGLDVAEKPKKEEKKTGPQVVATSFFIPLPNLLVNLSTPAGKQRFLKLSLVLELTKQEDVPQVQIILPRIIDQFQIYLRELRVDDLKGSEGIYRLREQLLARVNAETAPIKVHDVLFKDMLVQ